MTILFVRFFGAFYPPVPPPRAPVGGGQSELASGRRRVFFLSFLGLQN